MRPAQDLIDLKPNAPKEYRGDLNPIATNVPGIQISELLPNMARIMDKWTGIRSIVGRPTVRTIRSCATAAARIYL